MEIKGMEKLNKTVSTALKPFGIASAELSDEYAYLFTSEKVLFKITEDTMGDRLFIKFVKDRFDYDVRYPFIFSLLHEVGHHKTDEDVEGAVENFCQEEKAILTDAIANTTDEKEIEKYEYRYFSLPDEIIATAWAVKFCKEHPKKVENMWKKMETALMDFYKVNGVLDEIEGEGI